MPAENSDYRLFLSTAGPRNTSTGKAELDPKLSPPIANLPSEPPDDSGNGSDKENPKKPKKKNGDKHSPNQKKLDSIETSTSTTLKNKTPHKRRRFRFKGTIPTPRATPPAAPSLEASIPTSTNTLSPALFNYSSMFTRPGTLYEETHPGPNKGPIPSAPPAPKLLVTENTHVSTIKTDEESIAVYNSNQSDPPPYEDPKPSAPPRFGGADENGTHVLTGKPISCDAAVDPNLLLIATQQKQFDYIESLLKTRFFSTQELQACLAHIKKHERYYPQSTTDQLQQAIYQNNEGMLNDVLSAETVNPENILPVMQDSDFIIPYLFNLIQNKNITYFRVFLKFFDLSTYTNEKKQTLLMYAIENDCEYFAIEIIQNLKSDREYYFEAIDSQQKTAFSMAYEKKKFSVLIEIMRYYKLIPDENNTLSRSQERNVLIDHFFKNAVRAACEKGNLSFIKATGSIIGLFADELLTSNDPKQSLLYMCLANQHYPIFSYLFAKFSYSDNFLGALLESVLSTLRECPPGIVDTLNKSLGRKKKITFKCSDDSLVSEQQAALNKKWAELTIDERQALLDAEERLEDLQSRLEQLVPIAFSTTPSTICGTVSPHGATGVGTKRENLRVFSEQLLQKAICEKNTVLIIQLLAETQSEENEKVINNALFVLIERKSDLAFTFLDNHTFYFNEENDKSESFLHVACRENNEGFVGALLKKIPQSKKSEYLCRQDGRGMTPLHIACKQKKEDIVGKLINYISDNKDFANFITTQSIEGNAIKCFIIRDNKGKTPFFITLEESADTVARKFYMFFQEFGKKYAEKTETAHLEFFIKKVESSGGKKDKGENAEEGGGEKKTEEKKEEEYVDNDDALLANNEESDPTRKAFLFAIRALNTPTDGLTPLCAAIGSGCSLDTVNAALDQALIIPNNNANPPAKLAEKTSLKKQVEDHPRIKLGFLGTIKKLGSLTGAVALSQFIKQMMSLFKETSFAKIAGETPADDPSRAPSGTFPVPVKIIGCIFLATIGLPVTIGVCAYGLGCGASHLIKKTWFEKKAHQEDPPAEKIEKPPDKPPDKETIKQDNNNKGSVPPPQCPSCAQKNPITTPGWQSFYAPTPFAPAMPPVPEFTSSCALANAPPPASQSKTEAPEPSILKFLLKTWLELS